MSTQVKVYGADWCTATRLTRQQLDKLGVKYEYINVEEHPRLAEWVKEQSDGRERKPTLKINDEVLVVPSEAELKRALHKNGLI